MIGNRPRPWKFPTTPPVGDRKERIIGQSARYEIPLEIEDVLDKKNKKMNKNNAKMNKVSKGFQHG